MKGYWIILDEERSGFLEEIWRNLSQCTLSICLSVILHSNCILEVSPSVLTFQIALCLVFSSLAVNMNLHLAAANYSVWARHQLPHTEFLKTVEYETEVEL